MLGSATSRGRLEPRIAPIEVVTAIPRGPSEPGAGSARLDLPHDLEGEKVGGISLQEALDDLQSFPLRIPGQVDLRQCDVRALDLGVRLEKRLEEADRVFGLAAGDENEIQVVSRPPRSRDASRAPRRNRSPRGSVACLAEDEAEVVEGVGVIGRGRGGRSELLDRGRQIAAFREESAEVVAGLGEVRLHR